MGILGSIKKGFSVAGSSVPVALILFVFGFVFNVINLMITPENQDPNTPPSVPMIAVGIAFILITVFMQGASMAYVRNKIKQSSAALGDFFSSGMHFYIRIFVLSIIMALIIGVFVLAAALAVGALGESMRLVAAVLAILSAAMGIFVLLLFFFAPYIVVNEELGVIASLKRSVSLVRSSFIKVIGLALLLILAGFLVGIVIGFAVGFVSPMMPPMASKILFAFISSFVNAFLGLFVTSSFMSFYLSRSSSAPST